jgi:hypothetical protein
MSGVDCLTLLKSFREMGVQTPIFVTCPPAPQRKQATDSNRRDLQLGTRPRPVSSVSPKACRETVLLGKSSKFPIGTVIGDG